MIDDPDMGLLCVIAKVFGPATNDLAASGVPADPWDEKHFALHICRPRAI